MTQWIGVIGTVLGAVIGAGSTVFGQFITSRTSERAAHRAILVSLRGERRAAMEEFFEIYQKLEAGARKFEPGVRDTEPKDLDLMERLWIARNKLALIGSDQLQEPLNNVAYSLDDLYSFGPPEGQTAAKYMREPWRTFRRAAHEELQLK